MVKRVKKEKDVFLLEVLLGVTPFRHGSCEAQGMLILELSEAM